MKGKHKRMKTHLQIVSLALVLILVAACGGGGGGDTTQTPPPVTVTCDSTSVLENGQCVTFANRTDERATTPFTENGNPVTLEVLMFKPLQGAQFPTVVFHHGSTGTGTDPSLFTQTFFNKDIAKFFVDRGWMVVFPQRRGRGQSNGLYDEGFAPDRSAYTCNLTITLAGAERALDDLDAISDWLRMRTDVDTTQMLVAGTSRGGILSIVHAARRPDIYLAPLNFVGGWLGEGCAETTTVNRTLFLEGATFTGQSLWLYGENDSFYTIAHSQANFEAFTMAGGVGAFHVFTRAAGLNGHFIINDPELWGATVDGFLNQL